MRKVSKLSWDHFTRLIEVVPPAHGNPESHLSVLEETAALPITGFTVATNPVAKARMSALALASLIQQQTGKPAVLHITPRDHNRLALQGLLWGAKALHIETVLLTTGDIPAAQSSASVVGDLNLFDFISLAREAELQVGVVFDPASAPAETAPALERLQKKISLGAEFVITQPLYQPDTARQWADLLHSLGAQVLLGVLPLRSAKHARFMHTRVEGIEIPPQLLTDLERSKDPAALGLEHARQLIRLAKEHFQGVCLMPPFQQYHLSFELLGNTD